MISGAEKMGTTDLCSAGWKDLGSNGGGDDDDGDGWGDLIMSPSLFTDPPATTCCFCCSSCSSGGREWGLDGWLFVVPSLLLFTDQSVTVLSPSSSLATPPPLNQAGAAAVLQSFRKRPVLVPRIGHTFAYTAGTLQHDYQLSRKY